MKMPPRLIYWARLRPGSSRRCCGRVMPASRFGALATASPLSVDRQRWTARMSCSAPAASCRRAGADRAGWRCRPHRDRAARPERRNICRTSSQRAGIDTLVTDGGGDWRALRTVAISAALRPGASPPARAQRMGDVHLRHHRRAQDGGAQLWQALTGAIAPAQRAPSSGALSMTSAAMAVCRSCCARCWAAPR